MAGYTRTDTTNNIADGNIINATDLDNEFDGIQAAFNNSTGHNHDGTTGEGAPINVLGPTQDVVISTSAVTPKTTNTVDIGSNSLKFKDLYLAGAASIGGALSVTGVATFTAQPVLSSLTASRAVFTDGVKGLVSNAITGTGNVVMSTSPTLVTPVLGTPTSVTLTNATGLPISTGVSGLGTGVATFLATPSSANLAAAVTGETGTGALVFATSPTLVTPALGTPASGVLTNATGLPIASGISGLGTGVATALAVNVGTAGAVVLNGSTSSININGTVGATTPNTGAFTTLSATGNTTLGDATTDTITANGRFNTDVVPSTDNTYDLGTDSLYWQQVYATTFTENGFGIVSEADIGSEPNKIPLNQYLGEMAYMNAEAVVIQPQASVTPNGIGDMVFQLTDNTTLVVKVKGSDGTVRSATLTLA